jgi:hypothetical protein
MKSTLLFFFFLSNSTNGPDATGNFQAKDIDQPLPKSYTLHKNKVKVYVDLNINYNF